MKTYVFTITPWIIIDRWNLNDVFNQTLDLLSHGTSFKDALQRLLRSSEFDKYIQSNINVWVYWKSNTRKRYCIPQYEDIELE